MKPMEFRGVNCVYAKDQSEYLPLPAQKTEDGAVKTCWKLSLKERLTILFKGKLYLTILTFNKPLQPVKLTVI